jgi:hypothetical protein
MPSVLGKLDVESNRFYTFIVVGRASSLDLIQIVDMIEE